MASDLSSDVFPLYGRCFVRCFLSAVGDIVAVEGVVRMRGIMMEGKMVGDFNGMGKFRICGRGRKRRRWIFILITAIRTSEADLELQQEEEWENPL